VLTYPLMRSSGVADTAREGEVAVYRDQLAELQRERESGLIGETEAEYARAEIGRRLLAAASGKTGEVAAISPRKHNALASIVTVLLPLTGLCLYLFMGSPGMPDMPLQARLEKPGNDMNLMIAKAERHLAQNPDDGAGWDVLAPIYFKTMRLGDAEMAYRNAIRLQGE
ncbi:c-type cytochrome biogenesis protein CcmI, partial [Klebsiella pneumoniae]|uniref:c-type cytochrome biogenesis protein CcmI n=1 Tax=Klebsiella pneumoniae TaxID=573 RepID=UPI000E6816FE